MENEIKKDLEELADESVNFYEAMKENAEEAAEQAEDIAGAAAEAAAGAVETVENTVAEAEEEPEPVPEEPVETMEDYKEDLEKSFRQIHVGDVLEGTVIDVDETGVLMDLDYYAPGRIPVEEMSADPHFDIMNAVRIGDKYQATVKRRDDGHGNIILSKKDADVELSWDKLKRMQEEKTVITGKITETVRGGAIMYVEGIRGFIPASKLALTYVEDPETYLHKIVDVQVADVDEEGRRLVLSAKELLIQKAIEEKNKRIERLAVGNIVEGVVENIRDYGAFVNIGEGITGLLHISQIANQKVKHPGAVLKEGEKVKVMITKVGDGKVSLSMKAVSDLMAKELQEDEENEYHDGGEAVTSLGDLLKGFKFN